MNRAVDAADALSSSQAGRVSAEARAEYLLNVASKADGDYPSFRARDRRTAGLGPRSDFIDALVDAVTADTTLLRTRLTALHSLFEILLASKRPDAVAALVRAMTASSMALPDSARDAATKASDPDVNAALGDAPPF